MLCAKADGGAIAARWHKARLAIEFHASTTAFYHPSVAPRPSELTRLHASVGGRVVTATLYREPASHMRSSFLFWPPVNVSVPFERREALMGFAAWAEQVKEGSGAPVCSEGLSHAR